MTSINKTHNRNLDGTIHASTFGYEYLGGETVEQAFQRLAQAEIADDAEYGAQDARLMLHERHICHQNVFVFTGR